ncbi:MAG: hypothetical protein JNM10_12830 [Planctomycetia bacterium]|nr:hypothetical protein [Planctomycetia bacterium]
MPLPPATPRRCSSAAAVLAIVLAVLAVRAAWRDVGSKGRAREVAAVERLAGVVRQLPAEGELAFVDLGGDVDFQGRARIDLRLALAPRVMADLGNPAKASRPEERMPDTRGDRGGREDAAELTLVSWIDDPATVEARAAARGLAIERRLDEGYLVLRRLPR